MSGFRERVVRVPVGEVVKVKLFAPDSKLARMRRYRAPEGCGIDRKLLIENTLKALAEQFPGVEYKAVTVSGGINFLAQ